MNNLLKDAKADLELDKNKEMTMSSREIAELTGKRHDSVKRTMEVLRCKEVVSFTQSVEPTAGGGKPVRILLVNKRNSYIVVAQICPHFTALLVDRWQELESMQSPAPLLPKNYIEALESLIIKEKLLIEQAPKVSFVDNCVERGQLMTATQVAQKHKISAVKLNRFLDELGGVYSKSVKRSRVFLQPFIDDGMGEMKQTDLGYSQCLFSAKGEQWINSKLINEGVI